MIVADGRPGLARTVDVVGGRSGVEVVPVVPWPDRAGRDPRDLPTAVLRPPGVGEAAAANAGIAAATGDRVLLLRAGDEPRPSALDRHADTGGAVLCGRIAARPGEAEPVAAGWCGVSPPAGLPPSARFLSADRGLLVAAGGLDDRLHDLDVAALDLAARLRGAGHEVLCRADVVADAPSLTHEERRRAAVAAGRSAHALAVIDLARGAAPAPLSERLERLVLAWAEAPLLLLDGLTGHAVPALGRAALRGAFARGRGLPPLPVGAGDRLGIPEPGPRERPDVAVVVPFAGSRAEAEELLDALGRLRRGPGDDVVVVDNARSPTVQARDGVRVVRADGEWSSYHARNVGWRATSAPWLLFVDADCRPSPDLLASYFAPPPAPREGAVAGDVVDAPGPSLAERYSRAVGVLRQSAFLAQRPRGFAATANLLVRREALEEIGGFTEGIRSSGDADASHRLRDAGWELGHRPRAAVVHLHRASLPDLARQYRRYVSGVQWLRTRFPDVAPDWPPRPHEPLRRVPAHVLSARFGCALVQVITAWTMWRAGATDAAANAAERPADAAVHGEPVGAPG